MLCPLTSAAASLRLACLPQLGRQLCGRPWDCCQHVWLWPRGAESLGITGCLWRRRRPWRGSSTTEGVLNSSLCVSYISQGKSPFEIGCDSSNRLHERRVLDSRPFRKFVV